VRLEISTDGTAAGTLVVIDGVRVDPYDLDLRVQVDDGGPGISHGFRTRLRPRDFLDSATHTALDRNVDLASVTAARCHKIHPETGSACWLAAGHDVTRHAYYRLVDCHVELLEWPVEPAVAAVATEADRVPT
jgi:hypothetical protein